MTRRSAVLAMALMVLCLIALDLSVSVMPNPFKAPPLLALGSGQTAGGAHCAVLPPAAPAR